MEKLSLILIKFIKSFFYSLLIFGAAFFLELLVNNYIFLKKSGAGAFNYYISSFFNSFLDFYIIAAFLTLSLTSKSLGSFLIFLAGIIVDALTGSIIGLSSFSYILSLIILETYGEKYYIAGGSILSTLKAFLLFYGLTLLIASVMKFLLNIILL